jgi:hypothetical protein
MSKPSTKNMDYLEVVPEILQFVEYKDDQKPLLPFSLWTHEFGKHELTIQQAKISIQKGHSIDVLDGMHNKLFNIKFKIKPMTIQDKHKEGIKQLTFNLNKSILARIKNKYIAKLVMELVSPERINNWNYALKVFVTDADYLKNINEHIRINLIPYVKYPHAFNLMNMAHVLFTGLPNDEIIDVLANYEIQLKYPFYWENKPYTYLTLMLKEMKFEDIMKKRTSDLPQIYAPDCPQTQYWDGWQQIIFAIAETMLIWIIDYELNSHTVQTYDMDKPFIDVRIIRQIPDMFARIL